MQYHLKRKINIVKLFYIFKLKILTKQHFNPIDTLLRARDGVGLTKVLNLMSPCISQSYAKRHRRWKITKI